LPVVSIEDLYAKAKEIVGDYVPVQTSDKVIAKIIYRDGTEIDTIKQVKNKFHNPKEAITIR